MGAAETQRLISLPVGAVSTAPRDLRWMLVNAPPIQKWRNALPAFSISDEVSPIERSGTEIVYGHTTPRFSIYRFSDVERVLRDEKCLFDAKCRRLRSPRSWGMSRS